MSSAAVSQVLDALSALYSSNDSLAKKQASQWLELFQKQSEAWAVADYLLKMENANTETRLFAAQTLRQKITYDLRELTPEARYSLRDSLLHLLWASSTGIKSIMIQLCLAIADLAIQFKEWTTAVQDLMEKFGKTSEGAACLLEFLKVLAEEMTNNKRIPISDKEAEARSSVLIEQNVPTVMQLLELYIQSSAGNTVIQEEVFRCLSSWLRTGDVDIRLLETSPLLSAAFGGLSNEALFDVSVDVVCEIIYETKETHEYRALIERIYPLFSALIQPLREAKAAEDSDKVRGYCRMFIEAGEAYVIPIAQHPEAFVVLLEGIGECTAYEDLDIVPMTFKFWYELTNVLVSDQYKHTLSSFYGCYNALVDSIIRHLHYPEDVEELSAKERDEFRDFRHQMGDTLKDCCKVMTPQKCLLKPLALLTQLLSQPEAASWQQIEAPIFSLRSMGSEVPGDENEVMPQIMEFLSKLPDHPKIRYAATLVISRYSFWTRLHPQYVTYQLNYISAGFENAEVAAASALALKHLCKDCSELLVDFVSQLHPFYINIVRTLPFNDIIEVTEAVSHVISVIPVAETLNALQSFCLPIAQDLHAIVIEDKGNVGHSKLTKAGDLLEQISIFFEIVCPDIPVGTPHPCINFFNELLPVLDLCLSNFGNDPLIAEPLCRCFRNCIQSYKLHLTPLLPQLMERLVSGFDTSRLGVYLWVAHKLVREYSKEGSENVTLCFQLVERLSAIVFSTLSGKKFDEIPDVVEEYFRLTTALLDCAPTMVVQSTLISPVFQAGLTGLSLEEVRALTAIFSFYRHLLSIGLSVHELTTPNSQRTLANVGQNAEQVVALFREFGGDFIRLLFDGLIHFYSWELIADVAATLKSLAQLLPVESSQWMVTIVNGFPEQAMSPSERTEFLQTWTRAIQEKQWVKVRRVLSDFVSQYRRRNTNRK
ncbi:armadillo-type protein [Spinellus fusiger]|nr:armadillo-type protein [Spinellus fusiger]